MEGAAEILVLLGAEGLPPALRGIFLFVFLLVPIISRAIEQWNIGRKKSKDTPDITEKLNELEQSLDRIESVTAATLSHLVNNNGSGKNET